MANESSEKQPLKELALKFSGESVASPRHPYRNEDAIGIGDKNNWAAVLDGVGGSFAGFKASKKALEIITENLNSFESSSVEETKKKIKNTLIEASKKTHNEISGGETTAVVMKALRSEFFRNFAVIGSVGDSRAYLLRAGRLEQITEDDSPIPIEKRAKFDEVTDDRDLGDHEYGLFMHRSIITQDLGSMQIPNPHIYTIRLFRHDKVILTSDGIHDNLTSSEIKEIAEKEDDVAKMLVAIAQKRSEEGHLRSKADDMSAIVMEVQ